MQITPLPLPVATLPQAALPVPGDGGFAAVFLALALPPITLPASPQPSPPVADKATPSVGVPLEDTLSVASADGGVPPAALPPPLPTAALPVPLAALPVSTPEKRPVAPPPPRLADHPAPLTNRAAPAFPQMASPRPLTGDAETADPLPEVVVPAEPLWPQPVSVSETLSGPSPVPQPTTGDRPEQRQQIAPLGHGLPDLPKPRHNRAAADRVGMALPYPIAAKTPPVLQATTQQVAAAPASNPDLPPLARLTAAPTRDLPAAPSPPMPPSPPRSAADAAPVPADIRPRALPVVAQTVAQPIWRPTPLPQTALENLPPVPTPAAFTQPSAAIPDLPAISDSGRSAALPRLTDNVPLPPMPAPVIIHQTPTPLAAKARIPAAAQPPTMPETPWAAPKTTSPPPRSEGSLTTAIRLQTLTNTPRPASDASLAKPIPNAAPAGSTPPLPMPQVTAPVPPAALPQKAPLPVLVAPPGTPATKIQHVPDNLPPAKPGKMLPLPDTAAHSPVVDGQSRRQLPLPTAVPAALPPERPASGVAVPHSPAPELVEHTQAAPPSAAPLTPAPTPATHAQPALPTRSQPPATADAPPTEAAMADTPPPPKAAPDAGPKTAASDPILAPKLPPDPLVAEPAVAKPQPSASPFAADSLAPAPAQTAPAPHTPHPQAPEHRPNLLSQTSEALMAAVRQGEPGRLDLVLRPEELGQMRFEMSGRGQTLHICICVERPEAMDLVRRNAEHLLADLRQNGFAEATLSFGSWAQNQGERMPTPANPMLFSHEAALTAPDQPTAAPFVQRAAGGRLDIRL